MAIIVTDRGTLSGRDMLGGGRHFTLQLSVRDGRSLLRRPGFRPMESGAIFPNDTHEPERTSVSPNEVTPAGETPAMHVPSPALTAKPLEQVARLIEGGRAAPARLHPNQQHNDGPRGPINHQVVVHQVLATRRLKHP